MANNGEILAKVLNSYGLLDGDGDFKIVCPFHDDVNASMQITLSDGFFFCHGCHSSGDALQFVKYANKDMDDLQACIEMFRLVKKSKGIIISNKLATRPQKQSASKQSLVEAYDYYFGLKTLDWSKEKCVERDYMYGRGFLHTSLTRCKAKLTYNDHYPIIFPMFDLGKFKGWVCRTMNKKVEEKRKYLYNTGFSRKDTLVGDYKNKVVMLVEGYMDWLKMKQAGVQYVAAILGWKLTAEQITKLKNQGVTTIISALDNDVKGREGTAYAKQFFQVVPFQFPVGVKDPGELTQKTFELANRKTKELYRRQLRNGIIR